MGTVPAAEFGAQTRHIGSDRLHTRAVGVQGPTKDMQQLCLLLTAIAQLASTGRDLFLPLMKYVIILLSLLTSTFPMS